MVCLTNRGYMGNVAKVSQRIYLDGSEIPGD
jgi:hypothetical protein